MDLTPEQQKEIVLYFGNMITTTLSSNSDLYLNKIPEYWKRYRGEWSSKKDKSFPWSNSADFNLPIITWVVDSHYSRLMDAIFGANNIFKLVPISKNAVEPARRINEYGNSLLRNDDIFWKPISQWIQRLCVEGTGILYPCYEPHYIKSKRYSKIEDTLNKINMPTLAKAYKNLSGYLIPEVKEKVVYEFKVHCIPLGNFVFPFSNDNLDKSEWVAYQVDMTKREIMERGKDKSENGWINTDKINNASPQTDKGQEYRDKNRDNGLNETIVTNTDQPYKVYVVKGFYDLNKDGNTQDYIFIMELTTNTLLYYKENEDFWGKRRLVISQLFQQAGTLLGIGFGKRLGLMNDEFDTLHNLFIDSSVQSTAAIYTAIRSRFPNSANVDFSTMSIRPGMIMEVLGHDALKRVENNINTIDISKMESFIMGLIERLAIITDTSMGRESNIERPTARGKYMDLQEFLVNFGILVKQINIGLKELITNMFELMYQYMPSDGITYNIPNPDNPDEMQQGKITRQDLEYFIDGEMELFVTVDSINAAKSLVEQRITMIMDRLGQDQTGEINTAELKKFYIETLFPLLSNMIIRTPKELQKLQEMSDLLDQKAKILQHKQSTLDEQLGVVNKNTNQPPNPPPPPTNMQGGQ